MFLKDDEMGDEKADEVVGDNEVNTDLDWIEDMENVHVNRKERNGVLVHENLVDQVWLERLVKSKRAVRVNLQGKQASNRSRNFK